MPHLGSSSLMAEPREQVTKGVGSKGATISLQLTLYNPPKKTLRLLEHIENHPSYEQIVFGLEDGFRSRLLTRGCHVVSRLG